jgi:subtilisin family serine protease
VLLCAVTASAALAQSASGVRRFDTIADDDQMLNGRPLASSTMTVVLKLAGDPVAVVRSRAPGREISESERAAIEDNLRLQQDALAPTIEAMGGTVVGQFQNAINGIKVRATADGILSMSRLPGVVAVKPVRIYLPTNATSVPYIGAPAAWGSAAAGFRGEGIKLAIVDTGVDYTHANFGGPGTSAAFDEAFAHSTEPADPALFGPAAPKVKGGIDLVGDDYNASAPPGSPHLIPHPDPNPLDCNSHGSHVSGTAAGFGVNTDGTTFEGPWTSGTPAHPFRIGPGVAPLADLYAVRVFGCRGSTSVVVEALDWSVKNKMDIVSMSLGSDFRPEDDADAEASEHAAESGIIVVAAAGNAGPTVYFTGSPASGDKVLSAAAMDSNSPASFPAVNISSNTGKIVKAQNSNNGLVPSGKLSIFVMPNDGVDSLTGLPYSGCDEKKWIANKASVAGKLVLTLRGVCPRVDRATFGDKYGAAAVAMVNNGAGYPPFEGAIAGATIPFLGVLTADRATLFAATSATLSTAPPIPNPAFHAFASFSSGGPRNLDSHLKPDITAPGVNVVSTAMGSGNLGVAFSGTSMATPHVSGVAALALQSHPGWDPNDVRVAIANTADPSLVKGYLVRRGGSGVVQPFSATRTQVIARATDGSGSLSFGLAEFSSDFVRAQRLKVGNFGSASESFTASYTPLAGSPHTVKIEPSTFTVEEGEDVSLRVQLTVPAATSGNAQGSAGVFRQVSGLISLTPTSASGNNGVSLTVPYYLVPRARSEVRTRLSEDFGPAHPSGTAVARNSSRVVPGTADFYAWGLSGTQQKLGAAGLRGVGVQSFDIATGAPCTATSTCLLVFAVNTFGRWTTPVINEYDILVDANNDGAFDFVVAALGLTNGRMAVFLFDANTSKQLNQTAIFFADAPTNESTILLPIIAGDMGINAAHPSFAYGAQGLDGFTGKFDFLGETTTGAVAADAARFNAFNNAVSTGAFADVAPRATVSVPLTIDPVEFAKTPPLGVMVVGMENHSGSKEADLLRLGREGGDDD